MKNFLIIFFLLYVKTIFSFTIVNHTNLKSLRFTIFGKSANGSECTSPTKQQFDESKQIIIPIQFFLKNCTDQYRITAIFLFNQIFEISEINDDLLETFVIELQERSERERYKILKRKNENTIILKIPKHLIDDLNLLDEEEETCCELCTIL